MKMGRKLEGVYGAPWGREDERATGGGGRRACYGKWRRRGLTWEVEEERRATGSGGGEV